MEHERKRYAKANLESSIVKIKSVELQGADEQTSNNGLYKVNI